MTRHFAFAFLAAVAFLRLASGEDAFLEALERDKAATPKPVPSPSAAAQVSVPSPQEAVSGGQESIAKTVASADAEKEFKKADAELNAVYKQLKSILDQSNQTILTNTQRTWVASKEEVAKSMGSEEARLSFLTRVTRERSEKLRSVMKSVSDVKKVPAAQKASQTKLVRPDAANLAPGDILEGPWRTLDTTGGVTVLGAPYFSKMRIFAVNGYVSGRFAAVRYIGRNGMYFMCEPLN